MLKNAKDIREGKVSKKSGLQKRFWNDVSVKEVNGEFSSANCFSILRVPML